MYFLKVIIIKKKMILFLLFFIKRFLFFSGGRSPPPPYTNSDDEVYGLQFEVDDELAYMDESSAIPAHNPARPSICNGTPFPVWGEPSKGEPVQKLPPVFADWPSKFHWDKSY